MSVERNFSKDYLIWGINLAFIIIIIIIIIIIFLLYNVGGKFESHIS